MTLGIDAGFAVAENAAGQNREAGNGADDHRIDKDFKNSPNPFLEGMIGVGGGMRHGSRPLPRRAGERRRHRLKRCHFFRIAGKGAVCDLAKGVSE